LHLVDVALHVQSPVSWGTDADVSVKAMLCAVFPERKTDGHAAVNPLK
jgi:hypothetical protein